MVTCTNMRILLKYRRMKLIEDPIRRTETGKDGTFNDSENESEVNSLLRKLQSLNVRYSLTLEHAYILHISKVWHIDDLVLAS